MRILPVNPPSIPDRIPTAPNRYPFSPLLPAGYLRRNGWPGTVVDPYHAFLRDASGTSPVHAGGLWSFAGHRLAAQAPYSALCEFPRCRNLLNLKGKKGT